MQLCRGEEEEDTQCCFFQESSMHSRESMRLSRDGHNAGLKSRNNEKNLHAPCKETRLISKNHRKQKSGQKGKLSLSKLSARKVNSSREHCEPKPATLHNGTSHSSAPKPVQTPLPLPFNSAYHAPMLIPFQSGIAPASQNQRPHSFQYGQGMSHHSQPYQVRPESVRVGGYEEQGIRGNLYQSGQGFGYGHGHMAQGNNVQWHNQHQHQEFFNINEPPMAVMNQAHSHHNARLANLKHHSYQPQAPKPQSHNPEIIIIPPSNEQTHLQQPSRSTKTGMPTLETDRLMAQSGEKSQTGKMSLSKHKGSRVEARHVEFAESRFTVQNLSPYLDRTHLKTVQSIYSEDMNPKKQIHESVIIMDFFNPSESLKKQIEQKISHRYTANHNNLFPN